MNDVEPDGRCTLGVGCDESGICYANAHGHPEQCGREAAALTQLRRELDALALSIGEHILKRSEYLAALVAVERERDELARKQDWQLECNNRQAGTILERTQALAASEAKVLALTHLLKAARYHVDSEGDTSLLVAIDAALQTKGKLDE